MVFVIVAVVQPRIMGPLRSVPEEADGDDGAGAGSSDRDEIKF